ncbi:MAG TPA: cell wall-binding repeat-containing protein, partial [Coriobacteriia bacterium]|nr:cell wall-binding repeat-containing protein [Coriobacteriia bacterium]
GEGAVLRTTDGITWTGAAVTLEPADVVRIAGTDRILTAIEASKVAFPSPAGAPVVVIATARNWPDALGGAALAGVLGGPILLTEPTALPASVATEIDRLGASKAVILGGTAAVSLAVESSLDTLLGAANVDRIAGVDRYDTARRVAVETVAELGATFDGTVFVATGANFPDALAASPLAAAQGWPIYLVRPTGVDDALVASMNGVGVDHLLLLGGTSVVSSATDTALKSRVVATSYRLAGADRYATARVVATYGVTSAGLGWDHVALATGTNFPDALSGGVLQARADSVMLLTRPDVLYDGARQVLEDNRMAITEARILGGTGAVSTAVETAARAALVW